MYMSPCPPGGVFVWKNFTLLLDGKNLAGIRIDILAGSIGLTSCLFNVIAGGENWGTQPLSQYSWSHTDLQVESIWCPTTSNHSGKPFFI